MYEDTVVSFSHPDKISTEDPLTAALRMGARRLLADAVEAETEVFIAEHAELTDDGGRRRIVRHGHLPERSVQTGIGPVAVRRPRVRDRQPEAGGGQIRFTSSILPPYLRRAYMFRNWSGVLVENYIRDSLPGPVQLLIQLKYSWTDGLGCTATNVGAFRYKLIQGFRP